jgi:outer membrane protein assembly complex protein YaeT
VDLHYVVEAGGRDNLPRPPAGSEEARQPLDYLITSLSIPRARIRYSDRPKQVDVALSLPSVQLAGDALTDRHRLRVEGSSGTVQVGARTLAVDRLDGVLDVGRDDLKIDRLRAEAAGSRGELAGAVRNFQAPQLGLTLRATIDAARSGALLEVREPLRGTIAVDARASGPLAAPEIEAHLSGSDLAIRSLAAAQVDVRAAYDVEARRARVLSARLEAPWGRLTASGHLAIDRQQRSRLQAELSGINVAAMIRGLKLLYVAETRADGKLDAEWPGLEYLQASGSATASLTATTGAPAAKAMPVSGRVSARASGGTIVAELQPITAAGAELTGQVHIFEGRRLEGQLRANVPSSAATATAAETFLGRPHGSLMPMAVDGAAIVDARLGGTVDEPTAAANVTAPALSVGGANGVAVGADMAITPAALTIARADANWEGAHASVNGTVELSGTRRVDLVLDGGATDLQALGRAAGPAVPLSGAVSARGKISGTVARPLGALTLQGTGLNAFGEQFGSLAADIALAGSDITLSRFAVDKPQPEAPGRIDATGSFNIDSRNYTLDLTSENLRLVSLTLPGGQQVRGHVQLSGKGAGSVSSPVGTLNLTIDSLEIEGLRNGPAEMGRVVIAATAANQQATIRATADRFNLDADALVSLSRPWPAAVTVRANELDLERLPFGLETRLAGRLRATVNAAGDLAEPARGRATANIESIAGSWNKAPFSVAGPAELHYAGERVEITRLQVTARDSSLLVMGELPLAPRAGTGDVAVEAHATLATLAQLLPPELQVSGSGAVTLTGSLRGTLRSIAPDVVVTVENGVVSSPLLTPGASNIQLRARAAGGAAEIERLTGNWGTATIDASGIIPLDVLPALPVDIPRSGGSATIKASVRGLDVATVPGVPAGLTGQIGVLLDARAARADLTALEGRLAFDQLDLAFNGLTLAQKEPSALRIESGRATVERLALSGSAGDVVASGTAGFAGERPIDLKVDGTLKIGALSAFTDRIRTDGTATLTLAARGTMTAPEMNGSVSLEDATIASDDLNIAAVDVDAQINLAGRRVELTKLTGELNGGTLEGSGSLTVANGTLGDVDLQLIAKNVAYDAPLDLRSLSDATIRFNRSGDELLVTGQVSINEAGLTTDINFDEGAFAAITAPRTVDLTETRHPLLERVRFNVHVNTTSPVTVDNNLARAEIDADVRVVGTPYEPGLTGRLTAAEGGQITLNARHYEVERGEITFLAERRIVPSIDLRLNTKASNYDVRISVAGTPGKTETSWTSEPPLPEPDIMALVVTGRTVDEMRGEESEVARVQALSYLTGRVGSKFGRGLERATGISEVRIEPVLIANETDPTARLTVGQNVTDQVKLIYSTNLADSNDQIWVAEYDVTRRFQMRGVRERDDDSYRADFRHDLRFGGDPAPRRELRRRPTIASLTVPADAGIEAARLRKLLELKEGDTYEFFKARSGIERIEKAYVEAGFLQSRVRLDRRVENDRADLTLRITRGPLVELRYEGATPPSKIQEEVRAAWHHGVFDTQRGKDSVLVLREWLMRDKHLQARVEYDVNDAADRRQVAFRVVPGPEYDSVALVFEGVSGVDPDQLDTLIKERRLELALFTDPADAISLLERYCHEQGYLSAEIEGPRFDFQGTSARIVMVVREGPRFQVGQVTATGNTTYSENEILAKLSVSPGAPFVSAAAEYALEQIRELYWRKGYNDIRSEYALVVDRNAARVDVGFTIAEGRQSVVAEIAVEGNRRTTDDLVRGEIELTPSEPLDLAVLARSRRNLYNTGAFSIADITREDIEGAAPASPAAPGVDGAAGEGQRPVRVNVSVREVQPVQLRYGLSYDTEGGLGGILDFSIHNVLGNARVLGLHGRYDSEIHEGRLYVSQPSLRPWPRKTTASIYFREDLNPPTDNTDPFDISRQGASIQQEAHFRKVYIWSYGYRYELATTLEPSLGVGVTETVRVTPLSGTLTRETRDEVLDASKGTFLSQALAYSPSWLGSDRPYLKYYGQYSHYFPLRPERPKPFTNEILRARLVFATAIRVGLAEGLGGDVPTSERFYAGGSTTLRGFEQNAVGPVGVNNVPAGGNAVLLLNNELRMPLLKRIDGVLFVDIGNVYPLIADFSLTDLRQSAGLGLRLRTPWVLVRTDYGFVLDPRPGERRGRFYFGIGQAF